MKNRTWLLIKVMSAPALAAIMWAAQVSPEDVSSNFAKWMRFIGINDLPPFLLSKDVDSYIFWLALAFLVLYVVHMSFSLLIRLIEPLKTRIEQFRKTHHTEKLQFAVDSHLLNIFARKLHNTTAGFTQYVLYYSWDNGKRRMFDDIVPEGFAIKMFEHDIDADGLPELIVQYHCGAHTMVMRVYKVQEYNSIPVLISGAQIGSDWPDIRWRDGNKNESTIVVAKQRDWLKIPTQGFTEDKYLFKDGMCKKLS